MVNIMNPNLAAAVELKACPFCGGSAKIKIKQGSWGYYPEAAWVECTQCRVNARSYADDEKTKDGHKILAAAAWNHRPPVAGLAELTEILSFLDKIPKAIDAYGREGERRWSEGNTIHLELGPKHYEAMRLHDELQKTREFLGKVDG